MCEDYGLCIAINLNLTSNTPGRRAPGAAYIFRVGRVIETVTHVTQATAFEIVCSAKLITNFVSPLPSLSNNGLLRSNVGQLDQVCQDSWLLS